MINGKNGGRIRLAGWIVALGFRLMFPLSDPPSDLSWSGGYFADEGFWVHDARNQVLFGGNGSDEWHNAIVSPTIHYPVKIIFRMFGTGMMAIRLWAALLSIVALLFLDRILLRIDPGGRLFLFCAVNSTLVAYQRTGILESAVLPIAIFTMWIWLRSREASRAGPYILISFITGLSAAWVWQIKSTQLYFVVLVPLATVLSEPDTRRRMKGLLAQIAGVLTVVLIWWLTIYLPNQSLLHQYNAFYFSQQGNNLSDLLSNTVKQPPGVYFNRMPVLFPLSVAMIGITAVRRRFRLQSPAIVFAFLWASLALVALMPFGYRPFRYYLPALIPIVILGFRFLTDNGLFRMLTSMSLLSRSSVALLVLLSVSANVPILLDRFWLHGSLTGLPVLPGFSETAAIAVLIVSAAIIVLLLAPAKPLLRILPILFGTSLVFQIGTVGIRLVDRSYDVLNTSRCLARQLPANSVLGGQWAPQLALETPFRAVPVWKGFVNWRDPFERFGITHLLAWEYPLGNELTLQREWYPREMAGARKLGEFSIKDSPVSLWHIVPDDNHQVGSGIQADDF